MKISACMIAKNEERCIARCLESYKNFVHEIIVVDTGSTDRTVEIAKEFGAKIFHFEWCNDFAKAKNYALDQATGDWVLFLDSDEFLRKGDETALVDLIIQTDREKKYDSLMIPRWDYDHNEFSDEIFNGPLDPSKTGEINKMAYAPHLRAFLARPDIRFQGAVHEDLRVDIFGRNDFANPIFAENIIIYHDGYSSENKLEKLHRNVTIMDKSYNEGTLPKAVYYTLADNLYALDGFSYKVMHVLEEMVESCIEVVQQPSDPYALLQRCYEALNAPYKKRFEMAYTAKTLLRDSPIPPLLIGNLHHDLNHAQETIDFYEEALFLRQSYRNPIDTSHVTNEQRFPEIMVRLAIHYVDKGDLEQGLHYLSLALFTKNVVLKHVSNTNRYAASSVLPKMDFESIDIQSTALNNLFLIARQLPYEMVIKTIEKMFNTGDFAIIETVLPIMRRYCANEVFLTFFERWYTVTQKQDLNFFTMLMIIGEYQMAIDQFIARYEASQEGLYAQKALCAAVLSGKRAVADLCPRLPEECAHPALTYLNQYQGELKEEELIVMTNIAEDLLAIDGASERTLEWINKLAEGGGRASAVAAMLVMKRYYRAEALPLLENAYDITVGRKNYEDARSMASLAAQASFFLGRVKRGIIWAERALGYGEQPRSILNHAKWCLEKVTDAADKSSLASLVEEMEAWEELIFPLDSSYPPSKAQDSAALRLLNRIDGVGQIFNCAGRRMSIGEILNRQNRPLDAEESFIDAFKLEPRLGKYLIPNEDSYAYQYKYAPSNENANSSCPICGHNTEPLYCFNLLSSTEFDNTLHPIRMWMLCKKCRHISARNYTDDHDKNKSLTRTTLSPDINTEHGFDWTADVFSVLKKHKDSCSILAAGVFDKGFAEALTENGFTCDLAGNEQEPPEYFNVAADVLLPQEKQYDIIMLSGVIQSFVNPQEKLKLILKSLKPAGVVWLAIPDWEGSYSRKHRSHSEVWQLYRSMNLFSLNSLMLMLQAEGLRIIERHDSKRFNGWIEVIASS